jgi:tetratricopeptide (TPR) repeat protein
MLGVSRKTGVFALLLGACLTGCGGGPVRTFHTGNDTRQLSDAESRRWHAAHQLDDIWRKKGLVYDEPALTAYVQDIADRLYPEFKGTVKVRLVDSPELNAFALPNGSVYLNIGLVARMRNEAQLATVIGHEISHFTRQHSLKQHNAADSAVFAGMAVTVLTGIPLSGELLVAGAMSGYSQDMEREADKLGFERLARQGYDPNEAGKVFEIMREEVEALDIHQPFLYSSHPKLSERIASMQTLAVQHADGPHLTYTERFMRHTQPLRAKVLDRYLALRKYQILILILENPTLRARYPDYATFYLGEAYRQRGQNGDDKLAEYAYRQAMLLAPDYADSHRGLALLLMKRGDKTQAMSQLHTYLAMAPDAPDRGYIKSYIAKLRE